LLIYDYLKSAIIIKIFFVMGDYYFIIPLFVFGFVMTITPGPNNLMLLSSGVNFGVRSSLRHAYGIWIGNIVMLMTVGFGLGTLFTDFPLIHTLLKIISCIFLLYLAWKFGTTPPKILSCAESRKPLTIIQACTFQWVNPKAWIFTIGAMAAFSKGDNVFSQVLIIICILFIAMIISTFAWLSGGYFLEKILKTSKQQRVFNVFMGIVLALTVVSIIL
jgi:threonine/homoserine/homoserine lactone efflux protein